MLLTIVKGMMTQCLDLQDIEVHVTAQKRVLPDGRV